MDKEERKEEKKNDRMVVKEKGNGKFQNVSKNFVNREHFLFISVSII